MPEGDTVWRTARHLHRALAGRELTRCDIRVPRWATLDLTGTVVDEVVSRGKHLFVRAGETSLHTHLKMEGAWHVYHPSSRWRRPAHTARVVLENTERQAVGFSLGLVDVHPRSEESDVMAYLGPDLLGPDYDATEALRRLRADPDQPVVVALQDQRKVAGFGNEYANEIAFLHGLSPHHPVGAVDRLERVLDRGRRVLLLNRDTVDRSFTGSTRRGEDRWVYNRTGLPCRRCDTTIAETELGSEPTRRRRTFWCPVCQPAAP